VDRMACVDLPEFPLQLLLKRNADWREHPAAVVDSDRPQGTLLWVNERAHAARIQSGMRYAAALSLAGGLRAAVVPEEETKEAVGSLGHRLNYFTPGVEPAEDRPGVFWLDASGLERLHESLLRWGDLIRAELRRSGFRSTVVVGFNRFTTYALARVKRGVVVFNRPDEEAAAARHVPLSCLGLAPAARDALGRLGIRTLGGFIDLPAEGLEKRFGPEVLRLHRLATGSLQVPLQPERPLPPAIRRLALDHPETNVARLLVVIEKMMQPLLETVAGRSQAVSEVKVGFCFDRLGDHVETVKPASPTRSAKQLLELIRLRLQAVKRLPDAVVEVILMAGTVATTRKQMDLFTQKPKRDPEAANRALARIRAEFGDGSVVHARLREGHLPEGSFTWNRMDKLDDARPRDPKSGALVRRIYEQPRPLPARPRHEPDGWMLRGLEQGPVVRVLGPYVVSGGWWNRTVHREYHYAETQKGELLWVYYDRPRRRWYLHGRVE
jgi:protein ImuB